MRHSGIEIRVIVILTVAIHLFVFTNGISNFLIKFKTLFIHGDNLQFYCRQHCI